MNEIWKLVPGYENIYRVSNTGKVKSIDRYVGASHGSRQFRKGRILKHGIGKTGYPIVALCNGKTQKSFNVHHLVTLAFLGPRPTDRRWEVNHKDGNKENNLLSNLEYLTSRDNSLHAISTGLFDPNTNQRIYDQDIADMIGFRKDGMRVKEVAALFGISFGWMYKLQHRYEDSHPATVTNNATS